MGVDLTVDVIRIVNPTHLIQINSRSKKRNFPMELSIFNVWFHHGSWSSTSGPHEELNYVFHGIDSKAESGGQQNNNSW